jgi:hypothetical protein
MAENSRKKPRRLISVISKICWYSMPQITQIRMILKIMRNFASKRF